MEYKAEVLGSEEHPEVWLKIWGQSFQLAIDLEEDPLETAQWFASQAQKALDKLAGQAANIENKVYSVDTKGLFHLIEQEHGLSLTEGQLMDVVHEVVKALGVTQPAPAPAKGDILTPAEWLESNGMKLKYPVKDKHGNTWALPEDAMQSYAHHVAARVARNVRRRAAEIVGEEAGGNGIQCAESNARIYNRIMNIPLRDVYPAVGSGENKK